VLANGQFVSLSGKDIDVPAYDAISVEAWYTPGGAANTGFHTLFSFGTSVNNLGVDYFQYQPARNDNVSRTMVSHGSETEPWTVETGVNAAETDGAQMYHVVSILTVDGVSQYIDGVYSGFAPYTGVNALSAVSSDTAFFGKSVYLNDPTWKGSIQEVNIYNVELSAGEVAHQFATGPIMTAVEPASITFIVDDTDQATGTAFAIKGSWDTETGVYDASWTGGAEHSPFYDDGTNGDVTAGDHIWTVTLELIPDGGANTWEWGVNDADGNWIDGNFQFTVPDATAQTLDAFVIVGIEQAKLRTRVYPTVSDGTFNVEFTGNPGNITVYSVTGSKVLSRNANSSIETINLENEGIYLFRIETDNEINTVRVVCVK
jgi:hypothetical protein